MTENFFLFKTGCRLHTNMTLKATSGYRHKSYSA